MPNTPAAIGRGITVAVAAKNVSAAQRAIADALLRATGSVEWVDDESLMDAVTAVSGSGPAYVFLWMCRRPLNSIGIRFELYDNLFLTKGKAFAEVRRQRRAAPREHFWSGFSRGTTHIQQLV